MKKFLLLIIVLLMVPGVLVTKSTLAQENVKSDRTVVLRQDQVINEDYFASGNDITLSGTVNGDVYLLGGNIVVDGLVNGDLIVAGGNVDIRGRVAENVRAVGGQINISGQVGRNVSVAAGSVNTSNQASIEGNLAIGAGQAIVGGSVGRDVTAGVGQLTLAPNARINGNLNFWSDNQANVESGAQVLGTTNRNTPQRTPLDGSGIARVLAQTNLAFKIISLISYLLIGLLLLRFFPTFMGGVSETINNKPWVSLGVGLLTIILTPLIFIFLLVTIIGISLALIYLAVFLLFLYLSRIVVGFWIGQIILRLTGIKLADGWVLLLGLVAYGILTLIPVVGWFISTLVVLFGLGAIILQQIQYYRQLKSKNLI